MRRIGAMHGKSNNVIQLTRNSSAKCTRDQTQGTIRHEDADADELNSYRGERQAYPLLLREVAARPVVSAPFFFD